MTNTGPAVAYLDGITCRKGDFMVMKDAADRRGLVILTVFDGDATRFLGPSSRAQLVEMVKVAVAGIPDVVTLIVPRREYLGGHLFFVRRHVAVLLAETDELLDRRGGGR